VHRKSYNSQCYLRKHKYTSSHKNYFCYQLFYMIHLIHDNIMCRYSKCTCPVRICWRSEVVNHRTTDNVMAKWKGQLKQTMIYKTLHRKLKIEQQKPHYKPGINSSAPELCRNCDWVICQTSVRTPKKHYRYEEQHL
jgi:hypothetical protein